MVLSRLSGENQRSLANKGKSKSDKLIQNQTKCEKRIRAMALFRVAGG